MLNLNAIISILTKVLPKALSYIASSLIKIRNLTLMQYHHGTHTDQVSLTVPKVSFVAKTQQNKNSFLYLSSFVVQNIILDHVLNLVVSASLFQSRIDPQPFLVFHDLVIFEEHAPVTS